MRHTISVLVENKFGVLTRVAGLFSGREFNIESLNVAETMDPKVSRITIVSTGNGDTAGINKVTGDMTKMAAQVPALFEALSGMHSFTGYPFTAPIIA